MSKYGNETSNIYPDLNPIAPLQQEVNPQNYGLAKISEVEIYFSDKICKREKLAKKLLATISNAVGIELIATVVITDSLSITLFTTGGAFPIGMALSGMSILLPLENSASRKSNQLFAAK